MPINSNIRYFKLPFIGNFSNMTQIKVKQLSRRFCNDLDIMLVFSSYKIKDFFSFKDPVHTALKSFVVYQFSCLARDVTPVILVRPLAISQQGLKSTP